VADWLAARLGVREVFSPERLTRIVEAFETQLDGEQNADDLDYDESGRLNFSATDLAQNIGDPKGGAAAPRMTYSRRRRYGETHIGARVSQIDALLARIADYTREISSQGESLAAYRAQSLWVDEKLIDRGATVLAATAAAIASLDERALSARLGFLSLPRLQKDNGVVPEPIVYESLAEH
jgi:MoxR-like ATPase